MTKFQFALTELSLIPGIGTIDYRYNKDHEMVAQHNYHTCPLEVSFRGWYDPAMMMNACESIVAIWRYKTGH